MSNFCKILSKENETDILLYKGFNAGTDKMPPLYFFQIIKADRNNEWAMRTTTFSEPNKAKIDEMFESIDYLKAVQILKVKVEK